MAIEHFYIDTELNDDNAYKEAMQYACRLAENNAAIKRVVLLAATKNSVDWIERAFDSKTVKQLFDGMTFKNCKPIFKLETIKTYKGNTAPQDVVITIALDDKDILPLDDLYSTIAVIVVPWQKKYIQKYIDTWNPIDIRTGASSEEPIKEPSCIVKVALEELTNSINMGTGISNPLDNRRAKTMVLTLHKYEQELDGSLISSYLIRELGWDSRPASEIEKLITILNSGKSFQGGIRTGLQHAYKNWKEMCKN